MKTLALYMKSGSVIRAVVEDAAWGFCQNTGEIVELKITPTDGSKTIIGPVVLSQIEAIVIEGRETQH